MMLVNIFNAILKTTLTTSVIIMIMFLFSPLIDKRYAKTIWRGIWLIVGISLLIPINITLPHPPIEISLPSTVLTQEQTSNDLQETSEIPVGDNNADSKLHKKLSLNNVVPVIWLIGVVIMLIYQYLCYLSFKNSVERFSSPITSEPMLDSLNELLLKMNISKKLEMKFCKKIGTPMIIGFEPEILLPYEQFDSEDLQFILKHELIHFKRKDLWYKLFLLFVNAIHWFNPIVYFMVQEANKNIEITCDAGVVKDTDFAYRKKYSEIILMTIQKSNYKKTILSTCFIGGKNIMKQRFENIFDISKKKNGVFALSLIFISVISASMLLGFTYTDKYSNAKIIIISENKPGYTVIEQASGDTVNELAKKASEQGTLEDISAIAPFVSKEVLGELAKKAADQGRLKDISAIAPFVSKEVLGELAKKAADKGTLEDISSIAPFVSKEVLGELAKKAADKGTLEDISSIAPFVSKEVLGELAKKAADKGTLEDITSIAPFVSKEVLGELAKKAADQGRLKDISSIAPFVSKEVLGELAKKAADKGRLKDITSIAPFVSREVLDELVKKTLE